MAVMELEQHASHDMSNATADDRDKHDDSSSDGSDSWSKDAKNALQPTGDNFAGEGGEGELRDPDAAAEGRFGYQDPTGSNGLLPTFDSKGKFKDYKLRDDDVIPTPSTRGDDEALKRKCDKKYAIVLMPLLLFAAIISAVFLAQAGKEHPTMNFVLSKYGYLHIQHTDKTEGGWLSWPPEFDDDSSNEFGAEDGVTSVEECAAKCQSLKSPTGAWSEKYQTCWCNSVEVSNLCMEPCIRNEYIDFSTMPFSGIGFCEKSVCDKDWYYSKQYCDEDVKFDQNACDIMLETIVSSTSQNSPTPAKPELNPSDLDNLSEYGYPHTDYSGGWISWPPEFDNDSFDNFGPGDGITSIDECAAKCQGLMTPTGAWSEKLQTCFCNIVAISDICTEPCIENDYIDFSTVPFSDISYCEKSICDKDWYYSKEYCDVAVKFDQDTCDVKLQALAFSATDPDLFQYGYPHAKTGASGWISWPPEFDDDTFDVFGTAEGITSVEECAAKCETLKTPTGAWSEKYQACWCNSVDVRNICMEPCIETDYIDFSTVPLFDIGYCEKSVCDKDWYYNKDKEYCDVGIKFDQVACDVKLESLASSASELDLSEYGYPHSGNTAGGWISWPPEFDDDSFGDFGPDDGIASVEKCAAKCETLKAPTGAWSEKYQTCWCNSVEVSNICMEPCIENDYIDFSTMPLSDLGFCEKSICDKNWYYSKDYCDEDVNFDKDACEFKIETLASSSSQNTMPISNPTSTSAAEPEPSATDLDLARYGYPYTDSTAEGWLTWPPEFQDNLSEDFGPGDGVSSLQDCAAKCQGLKTSTGTWTATYKTCTCHRVEVSNLCKEPCIENDSVDFSSVSFSNIGYCEKSFCDQEWYYSEDYCDVDVQFNKDFCDAKIDSLSKLHISPSAVACIRKSYPDDLFGQQELRVERDESISYIRFDLSTISDGDMISKATMNLYLTPVDHTRATIIVDHIYAGSWSDESVSWNNPLKSKLAHYVNSFEVSSYTTNKIVEVDVTSAINPAYEVITFKLSTPSRGSYVFASREWQGEEAAPELVITVDT
eukprot:CAMPEP_0181106878 /NCGR_PEP_ID=MMETSP1071-20121207/16764_1 /TAXON_ID=35127 /ORGANISM="Thalassiosira sp., Strain NH16" /LENGTH=1050 /DNA_ID=CAMNT_0023190309 /DNA_START=134 /DNA_END=3286 /DNA_ORIENTATION=+